MMRCLFKKLSYCSVLVVYHKLDYLLRCVPPSAMKNLANNFDRQLLDAFIIKKTDIHLDQSTRN